MDYPDWAIAELEAVRSKHSGARASEEAVRSIYNEVSDILVRAFGPKAKNLRMTLARTVTGMQVALNLRPSMILDVNGTISTTPNLHVRYPHHCKECTFLGHYNGHDLYFCSQGLRPTVMARFGSDDQYVSGLPTAEHCSTSDDQDEFRALRVALLIARDRGLVPPSGGV